MYFHVQSPCASSSRPEAVRILPLRAAVAVFPNMHAPLSSLPMENRMATSKIGFLHRRVLVLIANQLMGVDRAVLILFDLAQQ